MTLFHFGNCFALAYFPYFITYKCSGLSEYNAFWRCVQAGATYLFVQLCKMLFLATFFPTWEGGAGAYDFVGEFMKATVDLADLVGLHLVMSRNAGKGEYKIMVAAMGWATAELVMSRFTTSPWLPWCGCLPATTCPSATACPSPCCWASVSTRPSSWNPSFTSSCWAAGQRCWSKLSSPASWRLAPWVSSLPWSTETNRPHPHPARDTLSSAT
ncbi:transmembrane protein 147 isoform X2 [Gopherus flavomarginatus]|uniref:transmembrane protein 147 isoform X2 n=1 Tax=Gopherus flavomarginatus TaxID=286002 RepID=UPI0021CBDE3A|nr:transmembrane protein 147 isoform X2 [Gopherus flavomarginatus]